MIDRNTLWGILAAVGLAAVGAVLKFLRLHKNRRIDWTFWRDLLIDACSSALLGLITHLICVYLFNLHPAVGAAFAGMVGHLGTRQVILTIKHYFNGGRH